MIVRVLRGGAQDYFGAGSAEANFANQYFSYVSPAPVSRANNLQFAAYAPTGRPPALFGGQDHATLAELQDVTAGTLSINLGDDEVQTATMDFSTATSFADVSSIVQAAIRAAGGAGSQYSSAVVSYDAINGIFVITGSQSSNAMASSTLSLAAMLVH